MKRRAELLAIKRQEEPEAITLSAIQNFVLSEAI